MRYYFSIICLMIFTNLNAQLLDLKNEWFSLNGFFLQKEVQSNNIQHIEVLKQHKKDGQAFKKERPFLSYSFFDNGLLRSSQRLVPLSRKYDTASFYFYYDKAEILFKRIEKQGPFKFDYYFINKDNQVIKEVKIDGNSPTYDTSYIRFYEHNHLQDRLESTIYNSANKAFMNLLKRFDHNKRVIYERQSYTRTSNYTEISYTYQLEWLLTKEVKTYLGKVKQKEWTYTYKQGKLDLVTLKKDNKLTNKYGVSYLKNGLVDVVIERDLIEKTITVYRFRYSYFH